MASFHNSIQKEWTSYVESLNHYFITNKVTDDPKKYVILMSGYQLTAYKVIHNLVDFETQTTNYIKPIDF